MTKYVGEGTNFTQTFDQKSFQSRVNHPLKVDNRDEESSKSTWSDWFKVLSKKVTLGLSYVDPRNLLKPKKPLLPT